MGGEEKGGGWRGGLKNRREQSEWKNLITGMCLIHKSGGEEK